MVLKKLFYYITATKIWARLTQSISHLKPSAICIGAQKSGTTALFNYLSYHPGVIRSRIKEINFFNCDVNFDHGYNFYHLFFPRKTFFTRDKTTLDITPGYILNADKTAKRIYDYNRTIPLILLLRNPANRAYSAWQMYRKLCNTNREWFYEWVERCEAPKGKDNYIRRSEAFGKSFEDDILEELELIKSGKNIEMPILPLGIYVNYLRHYYKYFPRDQILILSSEEMKMDTKKFLKMIEDFIGLEPHAWSEDELKPTFEGKYKDKMTDKEYSLLNLYYQDYNNELFDLIGRIFPWTKV